jgi:hypothetical protein
MLETVAVFTALWVLYRFTFKDQISNEPSKEELKDRRKEEWESRNATDHPIKLKLWGLLIVLGTAYLMFGLG